MELHEKNETFLLSHSVTHHCTISISGYVAAEVGWASRIGGGGVGELDDLLDMSRNFFVSITRERNKL